jgi:HEPN domain-containing protein
MKDTAVEWLHKLSKQRELDKFDWEQAKAMEKEQIIDAFVECWKENMPEGYECKQSAEQYYNETFKQD